MRPADGRKSSAQPVGTARSRPVAAGNAKISPSCHCETSPQTGRGNPYSYCLLPQGERIATSAPPPRNDNIGSFPFIGRTAECRPYATDGDLVKKRGCRNIRQPRAGKCSYNQMIHRRKLGSILTQPRSRNRKVTTWPLVQDLSGAKVVLVAPVVMPFSTAQSIAL